MYWNLFVGWKDGVIMKLGFFFIDPDFIEPDCLASLHYYNQTSLVNPIFKLPSLHVGSPAAGFYSSALLCGTSLDDIQSI